MTNYKPFLETVTCKNQQNQHWRKDFSPSCGCVYYKNQLIPIYTETVIYQLLISIFISQKVKIKYQSLLHFTLFQCQSQTCIIYYFCFNVLVDLQYCTLSLIYNFISTSISTHKVNNFHSVINELNRFKTIT